MTGTLLDDVTLGQLLALIIVGVTLLGAAVKVIRWVRPIVRKADNFFDDWAGVPARPGYEGRPGIPERVDVLEEQGGATVRSLDSLHDKVDKGLVTHDDIARIEASIGDIRDSLREHVDQAVTVDRTQDERLAELDRRVLVIETHLDIPRQSAPAAPPTV